MHFREASSSWFFQITSLQRSFEDKRINCRKVRGVYSLRYVNLSSFISPIIYIPVSWLAWSALQISQNGAQLSTTTVFRGYFYCRRISCKFPRGNVTWVTPWLTCSWKSIGRIVSVPYGEHIVYRWITEHERSIVLDFQPTRSVLYSAGLPDDLHFVRTENRSSFRFADMHAPSVCILQIDFMTKKLIVTKCSNSLVNFARGCVLWNIS